MALYTPTLRPIDRLPLPLLIQYIPSPLLAIIAKYDFPTNEWTLLYYALLKCLSRSIVKRVHADDWTPNMLPWLVIMIKSNQCLQSFLININQ